MNTHTRKLLINLVIVLILSLATWVIRSYASNGVSPSKTVTRQSEVFSEQQNNINPELYAVKKVVDGDTLDITINGVVARIRLIGINTPEVVDPRKPVECFGAEASNRAKELLNGKNVRIESDPTQADRDKYGRLLRYIYIEDGTFINQKMIQDGYAYEYTYDIPYKYQLQFKKAQKDAQEGRRGLWGDGVCVTK